MDASILLAFPLLLSLSNSCDACKCKLPHPQTIYCTSDVVLVAYIVGKGAEVGNTLAFKLNITQIYKGPLKAEEIHEIYTPNSQNLCGYRGVYHANPYLIAGFLKAGKIHFTTCHVMYQWARTTQEQRLGWEIYYSKGCDCEVRSCPYCWDSCGGLVGNVCWWKQQFCDFTYWEGENTMQHMCYLSTTGECQWTKIPIDGSDLTPR